MLYTLRDIGQMLFHGTSKLEIQTYRFNERLYPPRTLDLVQIEAMEARGLDPYPTMKIVALFLSEALDARKNVVHLTAVREEGETSDLDPRPGKPRESLHVRWNQESEDVREPLPDYIIDALFSEIFRLTGRYFQPGNGQFTVVRHAEAYTAAVEYAEYGINYLKGYDESIEPGQITRQLTITMEPITVPVPDAAAF